MLLFELIETGRLALLQRLLALSIRLLSHRLLSHRRLSLLLCLLLLLCSLHP